MISASNIQFQELFSFESVFHRFDKLNSRTCITLRGQISTFFWGGHESCIVHSITHINGCWLRLSSSPFSLRCVEITKKKTTRKAYIRSRSCVLPTTRVVLSILVLISYSLPVLSRILHNGRSFRLCFENTEHAFLIREVRLALMLKLLVIDSNKLEHKQQNACRVTKLIIWPSFEQLIV